MSFSSDRWRFIVEEARTGNILSRDLVVSKPKLLRAVSGPCSIQFDVNWRDLSAKGIYFKPWGHWIHAEKLIQGERKIWASGLVQPSQVDKKTGVVHLVAQGFSAYMKKMPWLDNWNPLANDAFEPVHKVWSTFRATLMGTWALRCTPPSQVSRCCPVTASMARLPTSTSLPNSSGRQTKRIAATTLTS
jgi:hypothetical protein